MRRRALVEAKDALNRRARLISLLLTLAFVAGEATAWVFAAPRRASEPRHSKPEEACCCCPIGRCGAVCACSGDERPETPALGCAGDLQSKDPATTAPDPSVKLFARGRARPASQHSETLPEAATAAPDSPLLLPEPPPPRAA